MPVIRKPGKFGAEIEIWVDEHGEALQKWGATGKALDQLDARRTQARATRPVIPEDTGHAGESRPKKQQNTDGRQRKPKKK